MSRFKVVAMLVAGMILFALGYLWSGNNSLDIVVEIGAVILALVGAYLVSSIRTDYQRLGFGLWIVSNSAWLIYGIVTGNYLISVQFGVFLLISLKGVLERRPR